MRLVVHACVPMHESEYLMHTVLIVLILEANAMGLIIVLSQETNWLAGMFLSRGHNKELNARTVTAIHALGQNNSM